MLINSFFYAVDLSHLWVHTSQTGTTKNGQSINKMSELFLRFPVYSILVDVNAKFTKSDQ